ncbi:Rhamnogalacturonyl hydrolase YesR [Paenibacillus sp. UNCCL117]|uniref:glycoside hydrolase family 88/105 protein n=1 Tax=unclassified Paenibacillus TaxID=185978 RepID=UPI00089094A8|nr:MULTISPECIES: glycoside hydrolase family 88 protein [unclassified Paenibacillus]SDC24063.1 Rhamnogalacturonyl hydrolase YesR [Paenibacillus sp. cl123]SFW19448.1 Rhamnogalacturonyl hydrolase YesR [Paenibacillus sp. UNCCL117]
MQQPYFDKHNSIARTSGGETEAVLTAVANRYIGSHPKQPPVYRTYRTDGFRRSADYRYEMNMEERLTNLADGQYVYVWSRLWSDQAAELPFSLSCYGPARVIFNGATVFRSNLNDDVFPDRAAWFRAPLLEGWNHVVLEFVKTGTGCGGRFGTGSIKGAPLHYLAPTPERDGQEGWVYSEPQSAAWPEFPSPGAEAEALSRRWLPEASWPQAELEKGCFARIFGGSPGQIAFAWTKLIVDGIGPQQIELSGTSHGQTALYLDGRQVYEGEGDFHLVLRAAFGEHDLLIRSARPEKDELGWGIAWQPLAEGSMARFEKPYPVEGLAEPWLYLGPFETGAVPEPGEVTRLDRAFSRSASRPEREGLTAPFPSADKGDAYVYWRADRPFTWVRPFLENGMFGKWNYPLGVTLYGLLRTGQQLGVRHYIDYAAEHIELCTRLDSYARWDQAKYGSPGVNHQLALIDSLDDCGSFGAAMLQTHKERKLQGAEEAAERIARYIALEQDRMPDGALYRVRGTTDFMQGTMWCDDLYMSVPFLCGYFELSGEQAYLDDAARQFLLYRSRLFMPDLQIMHHVYDAKFGKPNGVAWGRGNGWVLFSLSELLAVMPESHELRAELVAFYRELCEGYLRLQGRHGLWHQVLTDPESYEEASCTSMFLYAFARGARFGWLADPGPYVRAVFRGWEGLAARCIDKHGNVYGVCRGSGYSYSKYYYKDELTWQLNDTHGIGIVLLAGIETLKLKAFIRS